MNLPGPVVCFGLLLCAFGSAAQGACAQLQDTAVRWLVPSEPGGGYDAYSRLLEPFLEQRLGVEIVIDNRPAAGGIVAAMALRDARPDGSVLGILNASGLLAAALVADAPAPHPAQDFTVLARVVSNHTVMSTGRDSGIANLTDLFGVARRRPLLVGVRDLGSASFIAVPVTEQLLAVEFAIVTGYVGTSDRVLGAVRGEVDVVLHNFDSVRQFVAAGELVPLLQLTTPPHAAEPALAGVPALAGPGGVAEQRAGVQGLDPQRARQQADALAAVIGAGRLVAGPPGMPAALADCLGAVVLEVLGSHELRTAAGRRGLSVEAADARAALAGLRAGEAELAAFAPLVRAAVERTRR